MVGVFIWKFEINSYGKSLTLFQKEIGDLSCVEWDAALLMTFRIVGYGVCVHPPKYMNVIFFIQKYFLLNVSETITF